MDSKSIVSIISVGIVILAQAAGLYSFISSKIDENSQRLVEIEKRMIRIELAIDSIDGLKEASNINRERISDLEIANNQNFRKSIELERNFNSLREKIK